MADFDLTAPEQWFPVPGFDRYEISSHFRVRSWRPRFQTGRLASPRILAVFVSVSGYLVFHARKNGRHGTVYMHHVVAELVYGPRPDGMQVLHRDDNKRNNDPFNLYYGSPLQNATDSGRNGRHPRGETRSDARITEAEAREVFRLAQAGENQRAIAGRFGIAQQTVSRINRKQSWAHIHTHLEAGDARRAIEGTSPNGTSDPSPAPAPHQ